MADFKASFGIPTAFDNYVHFLTTAFDNYVHFLTIAFDNYVPPPDQQASDGGNF